MNVNYNLNRNVSVEGVYEVRDNNENLDAEDSSSLGADLKISKFDQTVLT